MVPAGHPAGGHSLPGVYAAQMAPSTSVPQHSYLQLAQQVRRDITLKRYAPGERLPSVRALAAAQGVSVATVVRCYRHLEALGMVQARHKSGMYVAEPAPVRAAPGAKDGADPSGGPGLQARARPAVPPPVEFDRLVSLEHRMTQLYALTTQQPLQWGLHLANAAPAWYPTEALARIAQRLLRSQPEMLGTYPTGSGLPALRTELAGWMATYGLDLQPDELLVTNGSTEALNVALRAVTRPGDAVVVESPVYFGLLQMLGNLGLRAIELPCTPGEGMSLEALEYALEHQSGVRAVVAMPNFQNPLGHVMPDRNKRRLLRLVEQHRPRVYVELGTWMGASAIPVARALRRWGGTLTCVDTWLGGLDAATGVAPWMLASCAKHLLRAGVTENPVRLTRSVKDALTYVTCGGAPVYIWPGGGITFMVDVTRLPENAFGYVPTPALVAPLEFTMKLSDYQELGGHMDHVRPLSELTADGRLKLPQRLDNPWPLAPERMRRSHG